MNHIICHMICHTSMSCLFLYLCFDKYFTPECSVQLAEIGVSDQRTYWVRSQDCGLLRNLKGDHLSGVLHATCCPKHLTFDLCYVYIRAPNQRSQTAFTCFLRLGLSNCFSVLIRLLAWDSNTTRDLLTIRSSSCTNQAKTE